MILRDFGVIILFIILCAIVVGGVTYKAVTEPEVFSLTKETPKCDVTSTC